MKVVAIILGIVLFFASIIGLSYGFGWIGVHQTKTIGKAQQNAEREVYEQTTSYVNGKRQEALKYYREYAKAESIGDKQAIRELVVLSFAEFDESKLKEPIRSFIEDCKY